MLWAVNNGAGALLAAGPQRRHLGAATRPAAGVPARPCTTPTARAIPDAEGVTLAGGRSAGGVYVATERNNAANSVSRPAILRFDPSRRAPR